MRRGTSWDVVKPILKSLQVNLINKYLIFSGIFPRPYTLCVHNQAGEIYGQIQDFHSQIQQI